MDIHPSAWQILEIVKNGHYTSAAGERVSIAERQTAAMNSTEVWTPADLDAMFERGVGKATGRLCEVLVIDATTTDAAKDFGERYGDVAVLNFASARNPGGGFLGGARAQEEELCRCSGLYSCIERMTTYYDVNRANRSALYTDHMIYSRDVPFFRTAEKAPLLDVPYLASVITAPAPNAGAILRNTPEVSAEIAAVFSRRWRNVLLVAAHHQHRTLVLGAWGCGAFRNDPEVAARTAAEWVRSPRFAAAFDRVVFAIPSFGRSGDNLEAFRRVLG
ncbi:MAG: TIGR02452 family protein [Polyangiaceae bacterium]